MKQLLRHSLLATLGLSLLASPCLAAFNGVVNLSAVVLSKSVCRFVTTSSTLAFGSLDPGNPVTVNMSTSLTFRCQGSANPATYQITPDDGLSPLGAGSPQMQHLTNPGNYIPYSISLSTLSGTIPKNVNQTLTIDGTILGSDYQTSIAGDYADTITISIIP
ncbi:MAG: hypothetical protein C0624_09765 [Desulfuromonas sp.]|nr:MAG: hypothetical protein C0624_09765 [Desulfuromonas sp.]